MIEPLLTIGMACSQDYAGVWSTVQELRLHYADLLDRCELIVVDNAPDTGAGRDTAHFCREHAGARYIAMPEPRGTAAPRQRIFDEARAPWVLCMDCHVFLFPGVLEKILRFNWIVDTCGIYHGPVYQDNLRELVGTHFDDVWFAGMWGRWGLDWRADPEHPIGQKWGTERAFKIRASGLGLFLAKRDEWPGFNPDFRGFGGEEWYIHEKIRLRRCGDAWCLPWLKWCHRWGYPDDKPPYVRKQIEMARNYVIGLTELGISLDRCREEFVGERWITQAQWEQLLCAQQQRSSDRGGMSVPGTGEEHTCTEKHTTG